MKICNDDPLIQVVRDDFGATPLRVPDSRFRPGAVIANPQTKGRQARFWGNISHVLPEFSEPQIVESPITQVSRVSTGSIGVSLGLKVLDGLLSGMGLAMPIQDIQAEIGLENAKEISLRFPSPRRRFMHLAQVGAGLEKLVLEKHGGTELFYESDYSLVFVDGVLETRELRVDARTEREISLSAGTAPLSADLTAKWDQHGSITFESTEPVPFAFTAVSLDLDVATGALSIEPKFEMSEAVGSAPGFAPMPPKRILLAQPDELFVSSLLDEI